MNFSAAPTSNSSRRAAGDSGRPLDGPSLLLSLSLLTIVILVLGSTSFFAVGLMSSGVTWTDGDRAYGAVGGDVSASLSPRISRIVEGVMGTAFFFGPVIIVPAAVGAVALARRARRDGRKTDVAAVATLVVAAAWLVLMAFWGDEVWVWALD